VRENGIDLDSGRISRTYNRYFQKVSKLCSRCYLSEDCKECVFNTGVETETLSCEFFSDRKKFTSHLAAIFDTLKKTTSYIPGSGRSICREIRNRTGFS